MRKSLTIIAALLLSMAISMNAFAEDANVTYSGDAGEFVFAPGSDHSPTDLFPNFKDVMPGDSISQQITVKNNASKKVKVEIYMRALGAHEDGISPDFLSQMHLRVEKAEDNAMAYMFDEAAHETAQLKDWVCLGTLYSGGEVNLNVILDVPVEMDNRFADQIGYLDWEFMVKEFPVEVDDPKPPQTGDEMNWMPWTVAATGAASGIVFVWRKKLREN